MQPEDFAPDPEETADRTPFACPFCGHNGAFDGHGQYIDRVKIVRSGVSFEFGQEVTRVRCPACNGRFEMRGQVSEVDE